MPSTVVIDSKTAKSILTSLDELKKEVAFLRSILLIKPRSTNWDAEMELGDKEISKGKYKTYKDADSFLNDLRNGV